MYNLPLDIYKDGENVSVRISYTPYIPYPPLPIHFLLQKVAAVSSTLVQRHPSSGNAFSKLDVCERNFHPYHLSNLEY